MITKRGDKFSRVGGIAKGLSLDDGGFRVRRTIPKARGLEAATRPHHDKSQSFDGSLFFYRTFIRWTARSVTGPIRPEGWSGSPAFHNRQVVKVYRPVGLGLPSRTHWGHSLSGDPPRRPGACHSQSSGSC